jgi:hypothetical protein
MNEIYNKVRERTKDTDLKFYIYADDIIWEEDVNKSKPLGARKNTD